MRFQEVARVLDALDGAGVACWVGGGWGVAALVGRQTRRHRDLDLAVDAGDLQRCLDALTGLGYVVETDWLPVRVELGADGSWVDVHPVSFDHSGRGRQAGLDGSEFVYPPTAFTVGTLYGRHVACLSAQQQLAFHTGYQPRSKDLHDLAQLDTLRSE